VVDAEVAQRRAEEHRRHVAFEERLRVERLQAAQRQLGVLVSSSCSSGLQVAHHRIAAERDRGRVAVLVLVLAPAALLANGRNLSRRRSSMPLNRPPEPAGQ
jgi:hypothetical protein